jgi:DNA-directed RNA polymerase sigma subunit (sigma70/sigma32)
MHGIGEHIINGMGLTRHEYNIYKMMGIYIDQCTSTNELTYEAYNEWVDRHVKQSKYYRTKYETWSYIYHKFYEDHEMINFDSLHEEEEESIYSIVCDIVDECNLTDQERAVIIERYKLDQKDRDRDVTPYKQIGKKMHIGYDTVKEIHERAIKKIQKSVRRNN